MKRLAKKEHWNKEFYTKKPSLFTRFVPEPFSAVHFRSIMKTVVKPGGSLLEIGAAPGDHLLSLAKELDINPYGLDYNELGVKRTKQNFVQAGFDAKNVVHADLFSPKVQRTFKGKFDVVYSAGFIEHFTDVESVITKHTSLLKKGGVLVLTVPNLRGMKAVVPADMLHIHNLSIMTPQALQKALPKDMKALQKGYYGGIANPGLVYYTNPVLEFCRLLFFVFHRYIIDTIQRILYLAGVVVQNTHTTPYVYIIAKRT